MRSTWGGRTLANALAAFAACVVLASFPSAAQETGSGATAGVVLMPAGGHDQTSVFTCSFDECLIVGEQSKWYVWFWCKSGDEYLKDTVTVAIDGEPSGRGEAKPAYAPKQVPTTKNPSNPKKSEMSLVTVDTKYFKSKPSTKPGLYSLHFGGRGGVNKKCPKTYELGFATIQVRPKITTAVAGNGKQKDVVWWFADAEPGPLDELGYTLKLQLTAHGEDREHVWKIEQAGKYAEFVGGGTEKTTTPPKIAVQVNRQVKKPNDLPKNKGDFKVTVTVNGAESEPVKLRVKRPYDAKPLLPPDDHDKLQNGYESILFYLVRDQFGKAMPKRMPVREHFTSAVVRDYKTTNWDPAEEGGAISKLVATIQDRVTGQSYIFNPLQKPHAKAPDSGSKAWKTPIHHWSGEVWVGSTEPRGVKVMTLTWQRFKDHARHCDIASPPNKTPICPCGALRQTGDCP